MTRSLITATEETSLGDIATLLEEHRIKRVPILRDGRIVGIVSRANLIRGLAVRSQPAKDGSMSDDVIRARIEDELHSQPWASNLMINTVVEDGVVHLWGFVPTSTDREALRILAEGMPGVRSVIDHLHRRRFALEG